MTSESETQTQDTPLKYGQGDEFTIVRGVHRGKAVKVMGVDKIKRQYAVQMTDGSFTVINEVNTKEAGEGKITAGNLASVMKEWADSDGDAEALVSLLSSRVDGFARAYGVDAPADAQNAG